MKQHILPAIKLTVICLVFFVGAYSLVILGFAQVAPNHGQGEEVIVNNKVVGYKLEGQSFTNDKYFNSRPSAVSYNAAASGASNKGPSNPDYLKMVKDRIDTFLVHNPTVKKEDIPADLVTASGSGLDPDISPKAAYIQTARIAAIRNISDAKLNTLIKNTIELSLWGIAGTEKVNVLQLNIALDNLK
ncbi:MAG: K(+)-transporting ATPase subunit C [Sphingobacteriales bacterium]|nr:K(+)-transporting ATPase subunit C [Sphingobacteriales bacterium]